MGRPDTTSGLNRRAIRRGVAVLLLSCLFSAQLVLAETKPDGALKQGKKELKAQQWARAEKTLTTATEDDPTNADAQALLGMAQYQLGKLEDACIHLTKAMDLRTSYPSRTLYYKGLCEAGLGQALEAESTFTQLASMYPDSPEARKLNIAPQDLQDAIARKETFLITGTIISGEIGYNSNPTQQADGDSDLFVNAFISADMELGRSDWSIGGGAFTETYLDDSDNDYTSLALDITRQIHLDSSSALKAIATADTSWYGGEAYERNIGILFIHSRGWDEIWSSEFRAGYEQASDQSDAGGADASRTEARVRVAANSSNGSIIERTRVELELRDEDNDTPWLGSRDASAGIEFRTCPFGNASLDLGIEYSSSSYGSEDPVTGITRDDTSVELSAYLFAPVSSTAALTAQISHDMRSSNISDYEADETVISAGIIIFP